MNGLGVAAEGQKLGVRREAHAGDLGTPLQTTPELIRLGVREGGGVTHTGDLGTPLQTTPELIRLGVREGGGRNTYWRSGHAASDHAGAHTPGGQRGGGA